MSKKPQKKVAGDNLRVRLVLNNDDVMQQSSAQNSKARARRAKLLQSKNVFHNKQIAEYTYHTDRIVAALVVLVLLLVGVGLGIKSLIGRDADTAIADNATVAVSAPVAPLISNNKNATSVAAAPDNAVNSQQVTRAVLAFKVKNSKPVVLVQGTQISLKKLQKSYKGRLYFLTEVEHAKGKALQHVWRYQGKMAMTMNIKAKQDFWRSISSKPINKNQLGAWEVALLDKQGNVLASRGFEVVK